MRHKTQFASDNWSGLCPQALAALIEANDGFLAPYGSDVWSQKASDMLSQFFETEVQVYFVATGTAANALALAQLSKSTGAVICHPFAHILNDECGAPGFLNPGMGLTPCDGPEGKIDLGSLSALLGRSKDLRHQHPSVLSLTQTTEVGTLYAEGELHLLTQYAARKGLKSHLDGARFMNAIVALDRSPADLTWRLGVDVLSLGVSKNGGGYGDAIILGLLENDVWRQNASHANQMARRLATRLEEEGVSLAFPCEANMVFVTLSSSAQLQLKAKGWVFNLPKEHGAARFVCGWNGDAVAVDLLARDIIEAVQGDREETP